MRTPMTQAQIERMRGPIYPMLPEKTSLLRQILNLF